MACIEGIIENRVDLKKYINTMKSKDVKQRKAKTPENKSHNPNGISNSMILSFFTMKNGENQQLREDMLSESDEKVTVKDIIQNGKPIIPSFWKKIRGLKNLKPKKMTIFKDVHGMDTDAQITALNAIQIGIAFNHLAGSIKTEFDLMNKYNLSEEEYRLVMPDGEFLPAVSATGTLAAIGKEILATQGIVLQPSQKGSKDYKEKQFETEKIYTDAGMKAVRLLARKDENGQSFITIEKPGKDYSPMVINEDYRKPNGGRLSNSKLIEGITIRFNMDKMLNLQSDKELTPQDKKLLEKYFRKQSSEYENKIIQDKWPTLHNNVRASVYMHRLLIPTNSKGPTTEGSTKNDPKKNDVKTSKRTMATLDQKSAGQLVIPDDLVSMFDFIYDKMEADGISFEDAAKTLGVNDYKEMMGFSDETDATAATRDSNMGKSLSKTGPLSQFFDNYSQLRSVEGMLPMHLQEEIKRNGRGHYMNTYLNPQTDKHFSRYIMQIPEYTIPAFQDGSMTDVFKHMLAGIQDQAGKSVTINMILGTEENQELDKLLASFEATDKKSGKEMFTFMSKAFKSYDAGLGGSVWQKYDTIRAIYDVRKMIQDNKDGTSAEFKGTFMPKPDGTASGAVIMAMQMAGKTDKNGSLFDALGLKSGVDGTLADAYDIALQELDDRSEGEKKQKLESPLTKAMDFFVDNDILKSRRELAKITSMPVMYSQARESSVATVGKELADITYRFLENNKRNFTVASQIKDWIKESDEDFYATIEKLEGKELVSALLSNDNSRVTYDAISTYMQKNVSSELYTIVEDKFINGYLSEHKAKTKFIFEKMKALNEQHGGKLSLMAPEMIFAETLKQNGGKFDINTFTPLTDQQLIDLKNGKDSGVPLMKLFGMVNHPEANATVSRWEYAHEINAHVNIVHSLDFAILNEAFRRTFDAAVDSESKNKALRDLDLVANGTISVHDAIAAHPTFSLEYTKHYREAARDINAVYDIHEMMTFELTQQEGYQEMIDAPGGSKIGKLRQEAIDARDAKIAELKQMDYDSDKVFGFSEFEAKSPIFGTPVSTEEKKKEAGKKKKKDTEEFDNSQMLTKYVTRKEGEASHKDVLEIVESGKPYAVLDTETTGMDKLGVSEATGPSRVNPSRPFQVAFTIVNPDGTTEQHSVYFKTSKLSEGVTAFFKDKGVDLKFINKEAAKDGRTNAQKLKFIEDTLGSMPIVAYNSDFDISSLQMMPGFDIENTNMDTAGADALGAVAHQRSSKDGSFIKDSDLSSTYEAVTGNKPLNAHEAMEDVNMTVELLKSIKPLKSKPKPTESTSNNNTKSEPVKTAEKYGSSPIVEEFLDNNDAEAILEEGPEFLHTNEDKIIIGAKEQRDELGITEEEGVAHEMVHFATHAYMNSPEGKKDRNVQYVRLVTDKLYDDQAFRTKLYDMEETSQGARRLLYILGDSNNIVRASELEAILIAEPDTAEEIYNIIDEHTNNLGARLKRAAVKLWNTIKQRVSKVKQSDIDKGDIDSVLLKQAVHGIMFAGQRYNKKTSPKTKKKYLTTSAAGKSKSNDRSKLEEVLKYDKNADTEYVANDPLTNFIAESNSLVADLLYKHFGKNAESIAKRGAKFVDKELMEKSSIYRSARGTALDIWDNPTMQEIKAYLVPSSVKQRADLQKMARVFQKANQNHGKITSTEITKLDNMMSGMSKDEVAKLNDIFAIAPAFMIIKNGGLLYDIADGTKSIDQAIEILEKQAKTEDAELAQDFANLYVDGNPTGNYYNIHMNGTTMKRKPIVEQLTALYSLKKIEGSQQALMDIREDRKDLFDKLVETSLALESTTNMAYRETGDKKRFRGNMTLEYYDEPFDLKVISADEISNGKLDVADEWETVIPATENHGYAVLSRKSGNSQYQEGFGTNVDYGGTDIYMPKDFKPTGSNMKNLVKFGSGKKTSYKIVIPMAKKKELGLIQNPAQTMLRSYAHIEKVRETQAIREEIVGNSGLRKKINSNEEFDTAEMKRLATERGEDEPWFIELDSHVDYSKLPDEIKRRFSPIKTKMSSVSGFGNKVSLVRNDIAPWMTGYKRALPFQDTPGLRKTFEIVTEAISLMKIHMIIVNPAKVTLDAISTTTLLMSYGVSPITIAKGWKRNIGLMSSMAKLKADQVDLTIRARGGNKAAAHKLKTVETKLLSHPLAGAINAGVMQSLTTDIITRDYDTITGLQRSIDKVFNKLTHDRDTGDVNNIHKAVVWFSKAGLNVEDLFGWLAKISEDSETFKHASEEIKIMGERISKIKKDEDVAKYLSEYFASPSSTLTRLGSMATTYPDAMSRIIYRDHLIAKSGKREKDMSDKEIEEINAKTSDFMPDYTFAPPMVLDATGRFFITPFVSYSARIQRVILNLAEKNPLTFFGSLLAADLMGLEPGDTPYHIVGSNYITKEEFINNVFTDLFDMQTVLPVNALNFDIIDL